jgi:uncharacterized protein
MSTTRLEIPSGGLQMVADLYAPAEPPAPHVILVHGFGGNRKERHIVAVAEGLQAAGIAVIAPDLTRNDGESEGSTQDLTLSHEVSDVREVVRHARERGEVSAIGLAGHSLGGLVAAMAAARESEVACLALLSAVCDFPSKFIASRGEEDINRWRREGVIYLDPEGKSKPLGLQFLDDLEVWDVSAELARLEVPTLILHGKADEEVPLDHALDYKRLLGGEAAMEVIEGADHTYNDEAHLQQVVSLTTGWFKARFGAPVDAR